jgi:hypothetical protein
MKLLTFLTLVLGFLLLFSSADVHDCVKAARRVHRRSAYPPYVNPPRPDQDPATIEDTSHLKIEPCMICEPANEECPVGCQDLLDYYYSSCSGVCLPDSYFFDPPMTMSGCWGDHAKEIGRHVERCGCSSAARVRNVIFTIIVMLISMVLLY